MLLDLLSLARHIRALLQLVHLLPDTYLVADSWVSRTFDRHEGVRHARRIHLQEGLCLTAQPRKQAECRVPLPSVYAVLELRDRVGLHLYPLQVRTRHSETCSCAVLRRTVPVA